MLEPGLAIAEAEGLRECAGLEEALVVESWLVMLVVVSEDVGLAPPSACAAGEGGGAEGQA